MSAINKTIFKLGCDVVQELLGQQEACIADGQRAIAELQQGTNQLRVNAVYIDLEKIQQIGQPNYMKEVVSVSRSPDSWTIAKVAAYVVSLITRLFSSAFNDEYKRQEVEDKMKEEIASNNATIQQQAALFENLSRQMADRELTARKQLLLPALKAIDETLQHIQQRREKREVRARETLIANALLDDPLAAFNNDEEVLIADENALEACLFAEKRQLETELVEVCVQLNPN